MKILQFLVGLAGFFMDAAWLFAQVQTLMHRKRRSGGGGAKMSGRNAQSQILSNCGKIG